VGIVAHRRWCSGERHTDFLALGGWGAGLLADRIGRVRTLQITIVWFAVFTFLSGMTTSFEQLLVTRSLQGLVSEASGRPVPC
jgi:MFS family permease